MRQYSLPSLTNLNNDIVRFPYLNSQRHLALAAPVPIPSQKRESISLIGSNKKH